MPVTIEQVTHEALSLSTNERAALARTLLNSLETTTDTLRANTALARRQELTQRFVSGEWGVELDGYEHARAADRAEARGQAERL